VSIEISKGNAVYDLVLLCRTGVIDMSDLEEFSDSTKDAVRQLLDLRCQTINSQVQIEDF